MISKGAAQSWQMENRGVRYLKREFSFGFAVDWMRKDLSIVLDEGPPQWRPRCRLPPLVDQFLRRRAEAGGHRV